MTAAPPDLDAIARAVVAGPDLGARMERLLTEARGLTRAEAGTVYVREGNRLRFAAVQNDALARRMGEEEFKRRAMAEPLSLSKTSIASYVALTRATVNLQGAYEIPVDRPYEFDPRFDLKFDYRTRSMLAMPLRNARGGVVGVMQLINALGDHDEVVPFDRRRQDLVGALLARVAVLLPPRGGA